MSKSQTGPSRRPRPASATKAHAKSQTKSTRTRSGTGRSTQSKPPTPVRFRTRHPVLTALIPVGLVIAAIATMVVIKASGSSNSPAAASSHLATGGGSAATDAQTTALSPQVVAALSVPAATLDAVGSPSTVALPTKTGASATARDSAGKPLITYVGAEYCPYCAAERWALAVALSRFGTFENLAGTHSSGSDIYPNTQTLSFYGSSYSSAYVDFQPVEETTNQRVGNSYQTLQTPTAAQTALLTKYDTQGSIPFLDIANKYVVSGSSFSPQVLQGLTRADIAADLSNPNTAVAQAIDGAANVITAAIVSVTGDQPSSVANSATIAAIVQKLGG